MSAEGPSARGASVQGLRPRRRRRSGRDKSLWDHVGIGMSAALLLAVIALAAVVIVIPKLSGATPLTVLTSSMEPGLPPGTLIVVKPVSTDDLVVGDVATYQIRSGEPDVVTHRIIAVSSTASGERSFEFQGDNNNAPDADPVLPEQVQGRIWYAVPLIGYVNAAVNGENRSWIIPTGAVLLFVYAGYTFASGLRGAVLDKGRGKATSPAVGDS